MKQPKIQLPRTKFDKTLDFIGWVVLAATWVLVLTSYSNLPETIPTHYGLNGQVDDFGNKWYIILIPIIASILYMAMTVLNKHPYLFNYPNIITEDNALKNYSNATLLVRFLKLLVAIASGFLTLKTIQFAKETPIEFGVWPLLTSVVLLGAPIFYLTVKTWK